MKDCVFCRIVEDASTASVVFEDSIILAFMDIRPVTAGHTLIIPKEHYAFIADMDQVTGAHLFNVTQQVAQAVRGSGVKCEGVDLFLADGEAAGQEIFHLHMHVIARYKGDGFLIKPTYGTVPTRADLNALASRMAAGIPNL